MAISENELCEHLESDDDQVVTAALRDHFEPVPVTSSVTYRWCLRPGATIERGRPPQREDESVLDQLGQRLLDLANGAQRLLRARRFARVRDNNPHWPVVVAEGDSWMAHPLIDDITDHLLDDDRYPYAVLGVGGGGDLLSDMELEREHERAVAEHGARALLLSGGANDLLVAFRSFLRLWTPGSHAERLLDPAFDRCLHEVMKTMHVLLTRARSRMPGVPILIHGYDYMRVFEHDEGGSLGPYFDEAGIVDLGERRAVMRIIVDRFNEQLAGVVSCIEDVDYLDVRGRVPDDEWDDESHPNGDGFSRVSTVFGDALRKRLG